MSEKKTNLTEDYRLSREVIEKLSYLIARGFVDLDWIIEESQRNSGKVAKELRKKKIKINKK